MSNRMIYPARRAVEHAVTVRGVRPRRLFGVLWPLWQVETTADIYDEQAYDVVDRFIVRAIDELELSRVEELARFLGTPEALVRRCVRFLTLIGHLRVDAADTLSLTDLGLSSLYNDVRYVPKESRQDLLVERFTARPLPRRHYEGSVWTVSSRAEAHERRADRTDFYPLHASTAFQPHLVERLDQHPDRVELNLPALLRNLRVVQKTDVYLPCYVIETMDSGLLVYTVVAPERDSFLEDICRDIPTIHNLIDAERRHDPREVWTAWLAEPDTTRRGTLRQLPSGIWRATLDAKSFGPPPRLPLTRVGSYELRRGHFLHVWCEDTDLRRRAAMERLLNLTRSREVGSQAAFSERVAELSQQLEVRAPTIAELRSHGERHGMHAEVVRLDQLE